MILRPPKTTRTSTLFPYTTLLRSEPAAAGRERCTAGTTAQRRRGRRHDRQRRGRPAGLSRRDGDTQGPRRAARRADAVQRLHALAHHVRPAPPHGMLVDRAVGRKQERERGIGNRECQRGATCRFPQHNPRGRTRGRAALTFPIPYSLFPAPTVPDGAKCRFHRIRTTDMQYPEWNWHNAPIKPWGEATTHVMSHALHYGSSVFEGLRSYDTPDGPAIFRLSDTHRRLFASARIHDMAIPYSLDEINAACRAVLQENTLGKAYLRPVAWRGLDRKSTRLNSSH